MSYLGDLKRSLLSHRMLKCNGLFTSSEKVCSRQTAGDYAVLSTIQVAVGLVLEQLSVLCINGATDRQSLLIRDLKGIR